MNAITRPVQLAGAPRGVIRPEPRHFFNGQQPDDAYGCPLHGDCLAPEINDGDMVLATAAGTPAIGDFVVLYPTNGGTPWLKRLFMPPMLPVGTPLHPDSSAAPVVGVEMLNPPRHIFLPCHTLTAMHRVVGLIRKDEVAALRAKATQPGRRPSPRRKAGAA